MPTTFGGQPYRHARRRRPGVAQYNSGASQGSSFSAPPGQTHDTPLGTNPAYSTIVGSSLATDPSYLAAQDQGRRQVGHAGATATFQRGQLAADYGFALAGNLDASNPFSRAALLQDSYRRAQRGTRNSFASAGQLYSGAQQRGQGETTRQFDIGFDQLVKGYQGAQGQVTLSELAAYANAAGGVGSGAFQALLDKLKGAG